MKKIIVVSVLFVIFQSMAFAQQSSSLDAWIVKNKLQNSELTTAQFEDLKRRVIGRKVTGTGKILDVKEIDGGYRVDVDLDENPLLTYPDAELFLEKTHPDTILNLKKNQKLFFTGNIIDIQKDLFYGVQLQIFVINTKTK